MPAHARAEPIGAGQAPGRAAVTKSTISRCGGPVRSTVSVAAGEFSMVANSALVNCTVVCASTISTAEIACGPIFGAPGTPVFTHASVTGSVAPMQGPLNLT